MSDKHETQISDVKNHLLKGWHLTQLKALDLYGTLRLSSIIHVLRHKHGMNIITDKVVLEDGRCVADYWLKRNYPINHKGA